MNPKIIRDKLIVHKGEKVLVKTYGMRNKTEKFIGVLKEFYPQIFTIESNGMIKSFSYAELINGELVLSFI